VWGLRGALDSCWDMGGVGAAFPFPFPFPLTTVVQETAVSLGFGMGREGAQVAVADLTGLGAFGAREEEASGAGLGSHLKWTDFDRPGEGSAFVSAFLKKRRASAGRFSRES
jgi:hypothetical protein